MQSAALTLWLEASAAVERRDWDGAVACLAPDCEWTLVPTGLRLIGTDAIRSFMQAGMAAGDRAPPEIKSAFGTDASGVLEYVSRGVATQSAEDFGRTASGEASALQAPGAGQPYEFHVCFVFRLDGSGLISEVREYFATPPPAA